MVKGNLIAGTLKKEVYNEKFENGHFAGDYS